MFNRRGFLQLSIVAAGGLAATRLLASERRSLGAQLYTVRHEAERDLPAVLEAVRKIGYTEVETYWDIYGHRAADLRRMMPIDIPVSLDHRVADLANGFED